MLTAKWAFLEKAAAECGAEIVLPAVSHHLKKSSWHDVRPVCRAAQSVK